MAILDDLQALYDTAGTPLLIIMVKLVGFFLILFMIL